MDLVIEILIELYMELMFLIIPEKHIGKKHTTIIKIVAVVVTIILIALFIWGIILITEKQNLWGIAPIAVAVTISLAQIIAGIILYKKHH